MTLHSSETTKPFAVSVVTSEHQDLIAQLIIKFGINASRAYGLVISRKLAATFQLEVWHLRQVAPRNLAGWMIQAIENNYGPPASYLEAREQQEVEMIAAVQGAAQKCGLCDNRGFRFIKSSKYPNGAMRECSHDPGIELQNRDSFERANPVADDALKGSIRGDAGEDDKRPAEDSAGL